MTLPAPAATGTGTAPLAMAGPHGRAAGARSQILKALLVWRKDLRIEWRNLDNLPAMFFFSLLVLVIFSFGFDFATASFQELGPGVLWVAFAFGGILAFGHAFALERDGDCIQGLMLAPIDGGTIYLGKMLASATSILIVEAALLPLSAVLFDYDLIGIAGPLSLVVAIHTIGFATIGTLFGAMTARTRRGDVLLPILVFSLSVPLMISAVRTTAAVLAREPLFGAAAGAAGSWLVMASIFDVVFLTAGYLTFEYILEE